MRGRCGWCGLFYRGQRIACRAHEDVERLWRDYVRGELRPKVKR